MRVQSTYDSFGWASAQAVRAGATGSLESTRLGSGFDRQRRAGERDRRRAEPRRAVDKVKDGPVPDPATALATIVASLSMGSPVEAQASCRYVTAAYADHD